MRSPVVIRDYKLYVFERRVHHFWVGLLYALSDVRDYKVWISDFRRK